MTAADRDTSKQIRHEIECGTPNTPQRIEQMRRADEAYERSFGRQLNRIAVLDWINTISHDEAANAFAEMQAEFRLPDDWNIGALHMGHALFFLKTIAERTL